MPCKNNSSSAECLLDFLWRMLIMALVMLALFLGILIPDFFRSKCHLNIKVKKADISKMRIIGKYSNWKFENSL